MNELLLSAQFDRETGVSELSHCYKFHENKQLDRKESSRDWKAEFTQCRAPENDIVKALTRGIASMEGYNQLRERKPRYTKYYLNIYFEGHCNKSHQSKNEWPSRYRAGKTAKYFKGILQAKVLFILTKSWVGHSSYTHVIINFRRVTSDIPHGKPQIIQIHSLLPE